MNRDEILAMEPGRELDALVAEKVLGWRECKVNGNHWAYGKPQDFDHIDDPLVRIEDYSTDISAAWEVVEKMNNVNHRMFAIEVGGFDNPLTIWRCTIKDFGWVEAPTAPEAICKASLLAELDL